MALKKKPKIFLAIGAFVILIGLSVVGFGVWSIYSFFSEIGSYSNRPIPPELAEPRVITGTGFLIKQEVFKKKALSTLGIFIEGRKIKNEDEQGAFRSSEVAKWIYGFSDVKQCGDRIVAAGNFGAFVLDSQGKLENTVLFEQLIDEIKGPFGKQRHPRDTTDDLRIVDIEGDGKCEFFSHSYSDGFSLFDSSGKVIWRLGEQKHEEYLARDKNESNNEVNSAHSGDVNDDGLQDFLITFEKDGLKAFNAKKEEIWTQKGDFPRPEFTFIDIDGDGKQEIFEKQGKGSKIREKLTGNVLKELELNSSVDGLFTANYEKEKPTVRTFSVNDNKLTLTDLDGVKIADWEAPLSEVKSATEAKGDHFHTDTESVYQPKSAVVRFQAGQKEYLVVLGTFTGIPRTNLYVYDLDGKLVYHELIGEHAEALSLLSNGSGSKGFIVVGKDTIWTYAGN